MNKLFRLYFFLLILPIYAQKPIPSWVDPKTCDPAIRIREDDVSDGYAILIYDKQCNTILEEDYYHHARKVISEAGLKACSQIEVSYDPSYEKAEFNYIRIIRNGNVIDRTRSSNIRILEEEKDRSAGILSNKKTIYVNLEDIRIEDVVEFAYTYKGYNPLFKNVFNAFDYIGSSESSGPVFLKYIFKPGEKINYHLVNTNIEPEIKKTSAGDTYVWDLKNPPIVKVEEKYPNWFIPWPYVVLTSFSDWMEVKRFNNKVVNAKKDKSS
ncbi:MAG: hypothetical protein K0S12_1222, partial [Bacteroidetes bacterium]|nr:hypothetical protein [Bacteroidota bacterium]